MKYYLLAGESSADQHAAYLIKAIQSEDENAQFRFWGGDQMEKASGNKAVKHIDQLAFMGFWEVLVNLRTILRNFRLAKGDIVAYQPDALILLDYPGFNLRIAEWASKKKFKVIYYIAPQVWAWKENRVKKIKRFCDKLLTILPFEEQYFQEKGVKQATFIGHPLMDHFSQFKPNSQGFEERENWFGIFPGSRLQEVQHILPPLTSLFETYPNVDFGLSQAPQLSHREDIYQPHIGSFNNVHLFSDRQHDLLAHCHSALVKSGTSTLEAAILDIPQAVIYKGNPISYMIGRQVVKVPYISLVNLILGYQLVDEHIQGEVNPSNMISAYEKLQDSNERERIREGYRELREKLGGAGASKRAAEEIVEIL